MMMEKYGNDYNDYEDDENVEDENYEVCASINLTNVYILTFSRRCFWSKKLCYAMHFSAMKINLRIILDPNEGTS